MDKQNAAPLYAQFDGDEVDGKTYALGEPMADGVDAATRAYLTSIGRFGNVKPPAPILVPAGDKALADMTRAELEATFRAEFPLAGEPDDRIILAIERMRAARASGRRLSDIDDPALDNMSEGPLDQPAPAVIAQVGDMTDVEALKSLRASEVAGKNRTTVTAAMDKRIEFLSGNNTPPPPPPPPGADLVEADNAKLREIAASEGVEGLGDDATDDAIRSAITAKRTEQTGQ